MLRVIFLGQLMMFVCIWTVTLITADADLAIVATAAVPPTLVAVFLVARKDLDLFQPLILVFAMAFIGSFLKAIYFVYFDEALFGREFSLAGLPVETLHQGAMTLSLAMLAVVLGYTLTETFLSSPRPAHRQNKLQFKNKNIIWVSVVTIALSIFYTAEFMSQTGFAEALQDGIVSAKRTHEDSAGVAPRGSSLGWLRIIAQTLPQMMMFVFLANVLTTGRITLFKGALLLVLIACSSAIPLIQSARQELLFTILISVIIFHYAYKKISPTKVAAIGVVLVMLIAALGQLRNQSFDTEPKDNLTIQKIMDSTLGIPYFMGIGKTSVIVERVPAQIDHLMGESLAYFLLAPIPRTLWTEKPVVRIGLFVGQVIFEKGNESGVPPGFPGELYLNFGFVGVFLGMFVYGIGYAALYVFTIKRRTGPVPIVVYSVGTILFSLTLLAGDLTIFMSQTFRYGLTLLLIIWLAKVRTQNRKNLVTEIA